MEAILYGDGVHSDYFAIQTMLDSGVSCVALPAPKVCYLIDKTLKIHGGQTLQLPPTAAIKLAPKSDCAMLEDCDFDVWKENIVIDGGIWDMDNMRQAPNPAWVAGEDGKTIWERLGTDRYNPCPVFSKLTSPPNVYTGYCMRFCRVKNFTIKNVTLKNPVTYGVQLSWAENFTVENITFAYEESPCYFYNMDGVHLEGNCRNGLICNLKGTCYDDMVALTADDGCCYGPIENVVIDGLWADNCHSAVRLLSHGEPVKNITVKNVFGSYFKYCIGLTKYHGGENERGVMENIAIENVLASSCAGLDDGVMRGGHRPIVWVQSGVDVENLRVEHVCRVERVGIAPLLQLEKGARIKRGRLADITQKNFTGKALEVLALEGETENVKREDIFNL